MRLSIRKEDPGYVELMRHIIALVDGKLIRECITADEEQGYIERYAFHPTGQPVIGDDGQRVVERIDGKVEIQGVPKRLRDERA